MGFKFFYDLDRSRTVKYLQFFLVLLLVYKSNLAFGQPVDIAIKISESITQALDERKREQEAFCQQVKANQDCKKPQKLNKQIFEINVGACEAEKKSLNCPAFFTDFPQYKQNAMSCTPYEICKQSLDSTLVEGCRRYGIELKKDFVDMLIALDQKPKCLGEWRCLAKYGLLATTAVINPMYFVNRFAKSTAESDVNAFKTDLSKLKKMACLDPETQAQLKCTLAAKYSGKIIEYAGAVKAVSVGARMALLERDLLKHELETAKPRAARRTFFSGIKCEPMPCPDGIKNLTLKNDVRLHVQEHLGGTLKQESILNDVSESIRGSVSLPSKNSIKRVLESKKSENGIPLFRHGKATTYYSEDFKLDELISDINNGKLTLKPEISGESRSKFVASRVRNGQQEEYVIVVCRKSSCESSPGSNSQYENGNIISIYPKCGPKFKLIPSIERVTNFLFDNRGSEISSVIQSVPCN